jgi:hypothetical protein
LTKTGKAGEENWLVQGKIWVFAQVNAQNRRKPLAIHLNYQTHLFSTMFVDYSAVFRIIVSLPIVIRQPMRAMGI